MSGTPGTSTVARRWQAFYDVLLGVVLFLSLLVPALRQASTGTLPGLRNGALLLLLDVAVLVMLSRYITSPGRHASRSARAVPAPEPLVVLSPEQAGVFLDEFGAPRASTGLTFSDTDIAVRQGADDAAPVARLAWEDCAAVVASQVTVPEGHTFWYLQFVATREDRIRRPPEAGHARLFAALLGLTGTAAAMVWAVPQPTRHLPPLVLRHVAQRHPGVRIVAAGYSLTEE